MIEYEVEIGSRPLGVRFAHADRGETVVVHLVLENKIGHKLGLLPGDILISINSKSVLDISSSEALELFRSQSLPFKASFRRFEDDDDFDSDYEENSDTDLTSHFQREDVNSIMHALSTQPTPKTFHNKTHSITIREWSVNDTCEWLLKCNQKYKIYINIFKNNNINGKILKKLNKNNLINYGINQQDAQDLYSGIQQLNSIVFNQPSIGQLASQLNANAPPPPSTVAVNTTPNVIANTGTATATATIPITTTATATATAITTATVPITNNTTNIANTNTNTNTALNDNDNDVDVDDNDDDDDDKANDDNSSASDNWEAPFLPYMYDAPQVTLSDKTSVAVYSSRVVSPYKKRAFALYEIEVIEGKDEWLLSKRYSEFYKLYEQMKKLGVKTKIKFPKKGIFYKSTDKQVMEDRKKKLTNYLNELLKDHPTARNSKQLADFLSPSRTFVVDE